MMNDTRYLHLLIIWKKIRSLHQKQPHLLSN